ncbi:Putative inhibitor of apoptosis [Trachymyrmex cornetzi]|uniref:Putative inhibitor of apoptosis n=1 Tax=Trachymyrmex cornetzi TaxID=471704 RepID=A0A151IV59_9HYME|nr:Putative inhibitor of apoptosis [Trachymyrmex cornetzi]
MINFIIEHIYEVPEDDYDYWFNEESLEEETIFFPVNNVNPIISESTYQELTCIICFTEKSNITFIPCGHLYCCKSCVQQLMHKRCRTCNNIYKKYISTIIP